MAFFSVFSFSLRLFVGLDFDFLKRWSLALISFFTPAVIHGGRSLFEHTRCGMNSSMALVSLDLKSIDSYLGHIWWLILIFISVAGALRGF